MSTTHPASTRVHQRTDQRLALADLVREMAMGQQEAMGRLYDATSPLIYGWLLRLLGQPEAAEAVTLDVYLKAWRSAASYSPDRGSVPQWLLAMAQSMATARRVTGEEHA